VFARHVRTLSPMIGATHLLGSMTYSPERLQAHREAPSYEALPEDIDAILGVSRVPANDALALAASGATSPTVDSTPVRIDLTTSATRAGVTPGVWPAGSQTDS
jgi:hypothetical protein